MSTMAARERGERSSIIMQRAMLQGVMERGCADERIEADTGGVRCG